MKHSKKVLLIILLILSACQPEQLWQLPNITGHMSDLSFALTDSNGRAVTARDYKGKVVLLYFGFAGCSTQCPLMLARLTQVAAQLNAAQLQILFVSINARDTPQQLHHYITAFNSKYISALLGSPENIRALAKRYRIFVSDDGISHSTAVFIFDSNGKARLLFMPGASDDAVLHDLRQLLS